MRERSLHIMRTMVRIYWRTSSQRLRQRRKADHDRDEETSETAVIIMTQRAKILQQLC